MMSNSARSCVWNFRVLLNRAIVRFCALSAARRRLVCTRLAGCVEWALIRVGPLLNAALTSAIDPQAGDVNPTNREFYCTA